MLSFHECLINQKYEAGTIEINQCKDMRIEIRPARFFKNNNLEYDVIQLT